MDSINLKILKELKANGRATVSDISKAVNLSMPAVAERIKKLEQNNVIEKHTIKINRSLLGHKLLAFILVNIDKTENIAAFRKEIVSMPNILECHHVAGEYDYLIKVLVEDTQKLELFLTKILKKIKGVSSSNTIICLSTLKEELNI